MRKHLLLLFSVWVLCSIGVVCAQSQRIERIKLPKLQQIMYHESSKLTIVNFWATWCKPCVAELPYFEALNKAYTQDQVRVLLVSLDPIGDFSKVSRFVEQRHISASVFLLDEKNQNHMIESIHKSWQGSLPYTLFIREKQMVAAYERALTREDLFKITRTFL